MTSPPLDQQSFRREPISRACFRGAKRCGHPGEKNLRGRFSGLPVASRPPGKGQHRSQVTENILGFQHTGKTRGTRLDLGPLGHQAEPYFGRHVCAGAAPRAEKAPGLQKELPACRNPMPDTSLRSHSRIKISANLGLCDAPASCQNFRSGIRGQHAATRGPTIQAAILRNANFEAARWGIAHGHDRNRVVAFHSIRINNRRSRHQRHNGTVAPAIASPIP